MIVRLKASIQSLVFVILLAATLFGAAGRLDLLEFWLYVVVVAAVSVLALAVIDDSDHLMVKGARCCEIAGYPAR